MIELNLLMGLGKPNIGKLKVKNNLNSNLKKVRHMVNNL
jgi:hypothetical protein